MRYTVGGMVSGAKQLSGESTVQGQTAMVVTSRELLPSSSNGVASIGGATPAAFSPSQKTVSLFARLVRSARGYLPASGLEFIERAYRRACLAHQDQERVSGEPYVNHCIETAQILADFRLESVPIAAALLHDILEDTPTTTDAVRIEFGDEVARLVEGVTKLSAIGFADLTPVDPSDGRRRDRAKAQAMQAENLRKLFLAMADDIRVVLIKLADRVHNMRTLQALELDRRTRIARETMEIYAPLAARLGIWQVKWQLEDLAFRHLEPIAYRRISRALAVKRADRERYIAQAVAKLSAELHKVGLHAQVVGRPKHIYSIFRKTARTGLDVTQLHDLLGVRVILEGADAECYTALGVVHQTWMPIPTPTGETGFRDYIAVPKENGYRSLHTTVLGPDATALEVQIRTEEMHRDAEFGVAAHWRYKEGKPRDLKFEERIAWIRQLLDWQSEMSGSAQEFVESL
ncbi:MAG: RelA/SpoT family protein, partial [Chloroflexota bacterium]